MLSFVFFLMMDVTGPQVQVEKHVIYQKETTIDLEGSDVTGDSHVPPAFFVTKMNTPQGEGQLAHRLRFKLRDVNELGF